MVMRVPLAFLLSATTARAMSTFAASSSKVRLGLCQVAVTADKVKNIANMRTQLSIAKDKGAELISLPECWNSPYSNAAFPRYAEAVPKVGERAREDTNPSIHALCSEAKKLGIWLVGGSIPEREGDRLYNTCVIINPEGEIVGKHRKVHLFDIDVPGKIRFMESDTLSPGDEVTVVDTPWGGVGVGICYDIRFPEYAILMRQKGANIFIYPGAFNMVTGPAHWELLQRARAMDNNVFCAACSPARDESPEAVYTAWGHSTLVSPWGKVIEKAGHTEDVIVSDVDLQECEEVRSSIPCWKQKRKDIYEVEIK